MASIRPFRGLRYSESAGPIDHLVAPPYDVLNQEERDAYAAKSPYNIVHMTLPESKPDDRSKFVKYARSSALLAEWTRDGILKKEEQPVLYRYTQTFSLSQTGETYTRSSIIVLLKTEPYENGVVLPHERTFPKHKEDRLRVLEATRAHLEEIFGLFEDPGAEIYKLIADAPVGPAVSVDSEDGVHQVLEPIEEKAAIEAIVSALAPNKLWIADGHHRYETALNFRASIGEKDHEIAEDFMPISLCSMSDPGLVLLPTHRILKSLPYGSGEIVSRLASHFELVEAPNHELLAQIAKVLESGKRALSVALPGGSGYVLIPKDEETLLSGVTTDGSNRLKGLDVTILHTLILENLLGVAGLDDISYTRDPSEAVEAVEKNNVAAFLMEAPTVEDMRTIALGGERMPQKSTYYFPKVLSGLVIWSLNEF